MAPVKAVLACKALPVPRAPHSGPQLVGAQLLEGDLVRGYHKERGEVALAVSRQLAMLSGVPSNVEVPWPLPDIMMRQAVLV